MRKKLQNDSLSNDSGIVLSHDMLVLLQAIISVDKEYLSYASTNANADNRVDVINQLERVFAYELYHQWSLLKHEGLVLNGEIGKIWNNEDWYPDMVLHGGQADPDNNKIVVEIKRECMVRNNKKAIIDDLKKLSGFLVPVDKNTQDKKFRNYNDAVFILLKGELSEISVALKDKELMSGLELNDNIMCVTYNEKKELRISRLLELR
ncbi:MAG: hypothetical protein IKX61_07525 [Prevotella sp.]|nr:hypothetical protein [Prevotella sp.]